MQVVRIKIDNFRGISKAELLLGGHTVLVGDNNSCKSTVLEAIDLVLGPERLSRHPVVDEHDFYAGIYCNDEGTPTKIEIEIVISQLNEDQVRHFKDHVEWWNEKTDALLDSPPPEGTDAEGIVPALRVGFSGYYDKEDDDFCGETFFLSPPQEEGDYVPFKTYDKRKCGFLFLRTLRTGSRALSLERGTLLDIILRLKEIRPQMWEQVLGELRKLPVAEDPALGITNVLTAVQEAVRVFVPIASADSPHIRVSDLTRDNLRRSLTVFMSTGAKCSDGTSHAAPFNHQGTGTINTLVLALLSLIAELKQNVIFAMEEPEIAIAPHTQKQIIDTIRKKSAQALFTSHSPYVLEEFDPAQICVMKREGGILTGIRVEYPPAVKPKAYRVELKTRFSEALLARKVIIVEGETEYLAYSVAARRLHFLQSDIFKTFESLGYSIFNAKTDSQIAPLGGYFRRLGKKVIAVFDKQKQGQLADIKANVDLAIESPENSFEKLLVNETAESALRTFGKGLVAEQEWPQHLASLAPTDQMPLADLKDALWQYFTWAKAAGGGADLLAQCTSDEFPSFIKNTLTQIQSFAAQRESSPQKENSKSNQEAV